MTSLPVEVRGRLEQFLRPLYTGLDGVDDFGRVLRLEERSRFLAGEEEIDGALLELLVLFHGVASRLGGLGPQSRFDLLLRGASLPAATIRRLRAGLEALPARCAGREEEVLHDALLLEQVGLGAAIARLVAAGRRKLAPERALATLDPGPGPGGFRTELGRAIAVRQRRRVERWLAELRGALEEEETLFS